MKPTKTVDCKNMEKFIWSSFNTGIRRTSARDIKLFLKNFCVLDKDEMGV